VFYRSVSVDGLSIFYREAGRPDASALLLLHGFPSSSRMFESTADPFVRAQYHLMPPIIRLRHSEMRPARQEFSYTFDHISQVMQPLPMVLGLQNTMCCTCRNYGGPSAFRRPVAHPERVQGFLIQNACAHEKGSVRLAEAAGSLRPTGLPNEADGEQTSHRWHETRRAI